MSEREGAERALRPREIIVSSSTTRSHCSSADWQLAPIQVDATEKASPSNGRGKYIHPVTPLPLSLSPCADRPHKRMCLLVSTARAVGRARAGVVLPRASRHEGNNFTSVMRPTAERTPQSLTRDFSLGGIEAEEGEREGGRGRAHNILPAGSLSNCLMRR